MMMIIIIREKERDEGIQRIQTIIFQAVHDPHGLDYFLNSREKTKKKTIIILALGWISKAYQEFYHSPIMCCMVLA